MSANDGSCKLHEEMQSTRCWNAFNGHNVYVTRKGEYTSTPICEFVPTRHHPIVGKILTDSDTKKEVFISHESKILVKLKEKSNLCMCEKTYSTQLPRLYLREVDSGCHELSPIALPPRSINLENQLNTKLDFAAFKADNTSRFLYHELFDDVTQALKISLKMFSIISRKSDLGIFEIEVPYFGLIRGDILSILHCKQQEYEVLSKTNFCTKVCKRKKILIEEFYNFSQ